MQENVYEYSNQEEVDKLLIFLLEKYYPSKTSLQIKYDDKLTENSDNRKIQSRHRDFKKVYDEAKRVGFIQEQEGKKEGPGKKPTEVHINWQKLSELLWEHLIDPQFVSNHGELIEKLAGLMEEHREFLFNLDAFKELFKSDEGYKFPSLKGFINTAICYVKIIEYFSLKVKNPELKTLRGWIYQTKEEGPRFINNVRFLVRRVWKEMNKSSDKSFEARELRFLKKQIQKYRKNYEKKTNVYNKFYYYIHCAQGSIRHSEKELFDQEPSEEEEDVGKLLEAIKEGRPGVWKGKTFSTLTQGILVKINQDDKRKLKKGQIIKCIVKKDKNKIKELWDKGYKTFSYKDKIVAMEEIGAEKNEIYKSPFEIIGLEAWLETAEMFR